MTNSPKVSIVIPVYNGADYLAAAIDSALAQTYPNIEILVVNDGSNDGGKTEGIVETYGARIRHVDKENGGVASALNAGIREMTGNYFSWLSHDDLYLPEKIQSQMDLAMKANRPCVFFSDYETIDESGQVIGHYALPHLSPEAVRPALLMAPFMHGCSLLVPREAFAEVGLFDESLLSTQDYDLWIRMAASYPFMHLPRILVQARIHVDQCTRQLGDRVVREGNRFYIRYLPSLQSDEILKYWPDGAFSYFLNASRAMKENGYRKAAYFAFLLAYYRDHRSGLRQFSQSIVALRKKTQSKD